ncbi:WD repeat protein [Talaromyces stipitatus ATCC 10500]|uniref:WD repeat protein n=1 Tax=Talaromyces stipitatus (strain ATCC 10500 / CBS 375.48 / QM 6759 / NRRL 1006) TaxID=441959 RepID=B8MIM4_TALSN|nr:WD repeat protein [Talaromyces stipitatus ATCC 10500]EED15116.1 WD repeat protein [Talaromyces stipitatus ATCC 10500]
MSSSDEDQDAEHLLSTFQSHPLPPTNDVPSSTPFTTVDHQPTPPKRRSRPPKVAVIIDLVDSEGSSPQQETPRRPRKQPKKNPVLRVESSDSENSQAVRRGNAGPRSRRCRAQVKNYYSNANYSGYFYVSEGEQETRPETQTQPRPTHSSRSVVPFTPKKPERRRFRVIYDSQGIRVSRHVFSKLQDIPDLPRTAPYSPQTKPVRYARQFRSKPQHPLLHVSFSEDEIQAIITLLAPYGVDGGLSEMSPADQVTDIVRAVNMNRLEQGFLEKLPQMIHLQKLLNSQGFDNLIAYHQAADSADPLIDNLCNETLSEKDTPAQASQSLVMAAALAKRSRSDIRAFLKDARRGNIPTRPFFITASREDACISKSEHRASILDKHPKQLSEEFSLRRSHTWKGASNDVLNLAWSPDGSKFAIGAAAQCDEHNMQYNRSNNLILGDYQHQTIKELPDHRVPYPVANHNNAHLYMSVTAVQWFEDTLYTASYDKTVKIWNVSSYANATCDRTLRHSHKVQVMARSPSIANILTTGTESTLHLWHLDDIGQTCYDLDYMSQRLSRNPRATKEAGFTPSSLAWGLSPLTRDLFVTGFSGKSYHEGDACREGLLAAWKVAESSLVAIQLQPNAQNIFDVKSHPFLTWFATGSSVSSIGTNGTGRDIRSLVRIYEPTTKPRCAIEFDCPALDINDVSFCPMDRFHISASCTDGVTYVWDFRNPSQILHKLCHGDAINQLDEELTREQADVGVRVALWGKGPDEFITGGSDGVLRSWNILRAPEDAHVRDIAAIQDEVMSGAFSPDKSTLLVGDAAGGIHILQPGSSSDPVEELHYEHTGETEFSASSESGRAIGKSLLETGQLIQHPRYGAGQGPAYRGPYAAWARPEETPKDMLSTTPLLEEIQALQLDQAATPAGDHSVAEYRKTAVIRNRDPSLLKRKDSPHHRPKKKHRVTPVIDLSSDKEYIKPIKPVRKSSKAPIWIDLTGDSEDEGCKIAAVDQQVRRDWDSEVDAEDYWFPDSGEIDPNIRYSD